MTLKHLNNILKDQVDNLNEFLSVIKEQQKSLVKNNYFGIEEAILNQEKILQKISTIEISIQTEIMNFAAEHNLPVKNFKLEDLITLLKNYQDDEILVLINNRDAIKEAATSIVKINNQNRILIDHSRNFIKETIFALTKNKKSFLDRKI